MSELLQRLLNIARAHLHDVLDLSDTATASWSDSDFTTTDAGAADDTNRRSPNGETRSHNQPPESASETTSILPRSPELVRAYAVLDLPFGAPREKVSEQWRSYLKRCHPDRFAANPAEQADATELTKVLTAAHHAIQMAWQQYSRTV